MIRTVEELRAIIRDDAVVNRKAAFGSFELTSRCNLNCRMCYICNPVKPVGAELIGEQWLDIMRQARDAGLIYAMLTGGEPLLHRDFWDIYLGLRKLGVYITLNSNGTTITPEVADRLKEYPPLLVQISLYGSSPKAYEKVTGSASGYEKAIQGVQLLKERGFNISLRTILTEDTAEDMVNMVPLILSYGGRFNYVNYILPPIHDNANDSCALRLDGNELVRYTKVIMDAVKTYYETNKGSLERTNIEKITTSGSPIESEREEVLLESTQFGCGAGTIRFGITYDGFIRSCELSRHPAFNLRDMTFSEGIEKLGQAIANVKYCAECADCTLRSKCTICPMQHYIESGDFNKKADYICEYVKTGIKIFE